MNRKFHTSIMAAMALMLMATGSANAALVGLWQFEDDFLDSSSFGNHGTQVNGVTFASGQAGFGKAAFFSGNDTRVAVPHDVSLDMTTAMTVAAFVNIEGTAWEGILAKAPSNGAGNNHAGNYELRIENGSRETVFLYQRGGNNDTTPQSGGAASVVDAAQWVHVAVTIDGPGQTANYYLDGALVATNGAIPVGFGATNTNELRIGSRADLFTDFDGLMDDVALFNEVLDSKQILAISQGDFSEFGVGGGVPEPATATLALLGLGGIVMRRRRNVA